MSKITRKPEVKTTPNKDKGRNTFQPKRINWSYLYLGKVPLTQIKRNKIKIIFIVNQNTPGKAFKGKISNGGNHPPKNSIVPRELIKIIAEYSPKNEHRPFCSRRCQLLDLGAWASEDRKIAGEEVFDVEEDETLH